MAKSLPIYELGSNVKIKGLNKTALIQQILFSFDGVQYQISYWDDTIRRVEWVFASELTRSPASTDGVINHG